MIDKLEAGKTYRLIDKGGYFKAFRDNEGIYKRCFKNNLVTVNHIDNGYGYTDPHNDSVIGVDEFDFFELVNDYEPLQTISSPFGELDRQTKKDLLCAWVDGAEIEIKIGYVNDNWKVIEYPDWCSHIIYRVKPTISAKEAAKAKLMSEAQQQLRDAQEALDKAQQL